MKRHSNQEHASIKLTLMIALFLTIAVNTYAVSDGVNGKSIMPVPGCLQGWLIDNTVKTFNPDNLYRHINGEAELFLLYGFKSLKTAVHTSKDNPDKSLAVDIYKMGSPLDAFGIYSRYRSPGVPDGKIGSSSFINDSQIMFHKGDYFIQISASGAVNPKQEEFIACAEAIEKNIPSGSSRPKELEMLNIPDVIPNTEIYISHSVLGYTFFKKGLVASANVDGDYVKIFVIFGGSKKESANMFEDYVKYLKGVDIKPQIDIKGNTTSLFTKDPLYKDVVIIRFDRYLFGATNVKDLKKINVLLDTIKTLVIQR